MAKITEYLEIILEGRDITFEQAKALLDTIFEGEVTEVQTAAFLTAMRAKKPSVTELAGLAKSLREHAVKVEADIDNLVDTCGTGGARLKTFNISTAAAIVAAGAGVHVAKHGNRGATSTSGSADVLEAAGVNLSLSADDVAAAIEQVGIGFMFAPAHHSAMKHVIAARKEIGVRTVFNLLGPLTNPAGAPNQIIGVFDAAWIPSMLEVLKELGSSHVLIVAAEDGLDEISIAAPSTIGELRDGKISLYSVEPADFGIASYADYSMLQIDSAEASLAMLKDALANKNQAAADIVALNAGAAIYAADLVGDLASGVTKAQEILKSGQALAKLEELVEFTQSIQT